VRTRDFRAISRRAENPFADSQDPTWWSNQTHKHDGHETALQILSGESGMWYGEKLEQHLVARAGDFLYIPANMPHQPYNLSDNESCVAVIARTDPNDQESIVLLPELERERGTVPSTRVEKQATSR
jgi:mannose-6-phosphate isomerase-like protein (cupin superfamily)